VLRGAATKPEVVGDNTVRVFSLRPLHHITINIVTCTLGVKVTTNSISALVKSSRTSQQTMRAVLTHLLEDGEYFQ
jgi:hypothetical protein